MMAQHWSVAKSPIRVFCGLILRGSSLSPRPQARFSSPARMNRSPQARIALVKPTLSRLSSFGGVSDAVGNVPKFGAFYSVKAITTTIASHFRVWRLPYVPTRLNCHN